MGARTKLYGQCVKPARIFINGVERPAEAACDARSTVKTPGVAAAKIALLMLAKRGALSAGDCLRYWRRIEGRGAIGTHGVRRLEATPRFRGVNLRVRLAGRGYRPRERSVRLATLCRVSRSTR